MTRDLHCHSTVSDGMFTPSELVTMAHENGCTLMALTDHDHIGGVKEAQSVAEKLGLRFITGVEVSVTWRKRSIHIVGLNFNLENKALESLLCRIRSGRLDRFAAICARLEDVSDIKGVYEGALAYAQNPEMASRTHIAQFLLDNGHINTTQQAFNKWLGEGKIADVKHQWASLEEVVHAIREAGGIAVIAHPMRYGLSATAMRNLLEDFTAAGGKGIEVACYSHSLNDRLNCALLAGRYGLYASAGSDFHSLNSFGRILGHSPDMPPLCKPIWLLFDG